MKKISIIISLTILLLQIPWRTAAEDVRDMLDLSIEELLDIHVVTASRYKQDIGDAPANIRVITSEMIERRGYKNLVEILEDLPGFDFATYEDGGGEYPNHGFSRGIGGDNGNTKLLIMVDDIIQNHIAFNWSMGWGNQIILHDVDRIEIIQGPGSALYGANAFAGIVHIITKKEYQEGDKFYIKPWVGDDDTRAIDLSYQGSKNDFHYSAAFRKFDSDGDGGKDRPDPGNYFHNNVEPNVLTQNYEPDGTTFRSIENNDVIPNPTGGQALEDGFNTSKDDLGIRMNLFYINPNKEITYGVKEAGIGFSYWDKEDGLGSYVPGYEYFATDSNFIVHHRNYHVFGKHDFQLSDSINLKSFVWYRVNRQMPDTGFVYTYRFHKLKKSYHSFSSQMAIDEQLHLSIGDDSNLILGGRFLTEQKMDQVISLGREQSGESSTSTASWDRAINEDGLLSEKTIPIFRENEWSLYGEFDDVLNEYVSYSLGTRYDYSTGFGSTMNPRLGVILRLPIDSWHVPIEEWRIKFLYGSAFREPSVFELRDEFRGNEDLDSEKIDTFEIENNISIFNSNSREYINKLDMKLNLFYSSLTDVISLVQDSRRSLTENPSGEIHENVGRFEIRGFSTDFDLMATKDFSFYFNYIFTQGNQDDENRWTDIDHVAKHKFNMGFNWLALRDYLNVNFRINYIGDRSVPTTNTFFADDASGYMKANLSLTFKDIARKWTDKVKVEPQIIVKNIFDEAYFGVGRQGGSSNRDEYDPQTNPDAAGFIPPYHPQPGRTWFVNLKVTY